MLDLERRPKLRAAVVPDPYFNRAYPESETNTAERVVAINLGESVIVMLQNRGKLEPWQSKAAERFRSLWEALGGAGAKAIDYTRTHVDGGGAGDITNQRQFNAGVELAECRELLGERLYSLVSRTCGEGWSFAQLAATRRERETMADMLRMALDDLAGKWHLRATVNGNPKFVHWSGEHEAK